MYYNFFVTNKNEFNTETFGKRLARLRKERGLSQTELSEKIGISQSTLTDYERDILRLHDSLIVKLSKILKVSSDELLGLKGTKDYKGNPSLRFLKRLKEIENLPEVRKKMIIRMLDDLIFASENKTNS